MSAAVTSLTIGTEMLAFVLDKWLKICCFMLPSIRVARLLAYCVLIGSLAELYLAFACGMCWHVADLLRLSLAGWYHQWLLPWLWKSIAISNSFHGVVPRTRSCSGLISLCTWPHQVLTRTLSYQHHCWTWPHQALKWTFCYQRPLEVQLSLGLTTLGDPIQSIPGLWNQPFQVGTHHGLSLVRKTRCLLLWLRSNRTPALMLWVVLVTTIVTI